jgi:hypothetical protein
VDADQDFHDDSAASGDRDSDSDSDEEGKISETQNRFTKDKPRGRSRSQSPTPLKLLTKAAAAEKLQAARREIRDEIEQRRVSQSENNNELEEIEGGIQYQEPKLMEFEGRLRPDRYGGVERGYPYSRLDIPSEA